MSSGAAGLPTPAETEKSTVAIRKATRQAYEDGNFEVSMLPVGDGVLMARRLR